VGCSKFNLHLNSEKEEKKNGCVYCREKTIIVTMVVERKNGGEEHMRKLSS
jgi:hypothetical protein